MSLMQIFTKFLETFLKKSSPELQKKQQHKKIEAEIKAMNPVLLKNGNLQPNFAEAIYTLYKNTKILDDLFSVTVSMNDIQRQHRFEAQLILTGFNPPEQEMLEALSFENRKAEILAEEGVEKEENRVYERQRQNQEKLFKALAKENFKSIDNEILQLRQLVDFCKTSYLPVLQLFDGNFIPGDSGYQPSYTEIPIPKLINVLEDLYYQTYGLKITAGTANAIVALAQLRAGGNLSQEKSDNYVTALKRIAYVITKILTQDNLKTLIRYEKNDENYEPRICSYVGSPRQDFAQMMKDKFLADEKRIKSELQDERIEEELTSLFNGESLLTVNSYNGEQNEALIKNTSLAFKYVLPMRILKTFLQVYFPESIRVLLNDLVIEGFFINQKYKKSFSETVFACLGADESIQNFENSFGNDMPNSIAVLQSYIKDSHRDKDFYKKLEIMVERINETAKNLIQTYTTHLHALYKMLGELLADAKKPTSEIIENLKVTMLSSRNKGNTNFLEQNYGNWKFFFDIMKNYVIINTAVANNSNVS